MNLSTIIKWQLLWCGNLWLQFVLGIEPRRGLTPRTIGMHVFQKLTQIPY